MAAFDEVKSNRQLKREEDERKKERISTLEKKADGVMRENERHRVVGNRTQYETGCRILTGMRKEINELQRDLQHGREQY